MKSLSEHSVDLNIVLFCPVCAIICGAWPWIVLSTISQFCNIRISYFERFERIYTHQTEWILSICFKNMTEQKGAFLADDVILEWTYDTLKHDSDSPFSNLHMNNHHKIFRRPVNQSHSGFTVYIVLPFRRCCHVEPRCRCSAMSHWQFKIIFTVIFCCVVLFTLLSERFLPRLAKRKVSLRWKALESSGGTSALLRGDEKRRLILVYTTLFGSGEWYHLPAKEAANFSSKCKFKNCEVSYDRARLQQSDAVVFHARDMPSPPFLQDYSRRLRPSHQRWGYFISETPRNTPDRKPLDGLFNWTMTYKKESDIWLPYKKYHALQDNEERLPVKNYAAEKNAVVNRKLAFWINSNCGKFRDRYVLKLQELVSLDVAGGCANNFKSPIVDCNKQGRDSCVATARKYKFYLSFENSFCNQYVTEKYWYNAMEFDTVPIVLGGGPYNDPNVAIPGSYINVEDFSTVKELADYLLYLDKNDTAYNEYFEWKGKYKLTDDVGWPFPDIFVCEICEKLHTDYTAKVYEHLSDFWSWADCKDDQSTKLNEILNRS